MTIFNLHAAVLSDYRNLVRSFVTVADERIRTFLDQALVEEQRLWPEFLLQVSPSYVRSATVDELAVRGILHAETARIFRTAEGKPFHLYRHQVEALEKARAGESYVVTSGTGSGKSLTYFIPIVDSLLRGPPAGERVAALVVYPMNALVNSQLQALEKLREGYEHRTGRPFPVTFAKYTGETTEDTRNALRNRPPQILLTNYVMGELLLVRPEACVFSFLTSFTPTEAARAQMSPCSCGGSRSAVPVLRSPVWAPAPPWWRAERRPPRGGVRRWPILRRSSLVTR
jgi:ATP-dependent helicase YprA (DUF1998 family)